MSYLTAGTIVRFTFMFRTYDVDEEPITFLPIPETLSFYFFAFCVVLEQIIKFVYCSVVVVYQTSIVAVCVN